MTDEASGGQSGIDDLIARLREESTETLMPMVIRNLIREAADALEATQTPVRRYQQELDAQVTRYPWHLAPPDAEWAATDENGLRRFYEDEPQQLTCGWFVLSGASWPIIACPDWRDSLERRPVKKKAWRRLGKDRMDVIGYVISFDDPKSPYLVDVRIRWLGPVEEFEYEVQP